MTSQGRESSRTKYQWVLFIAKEITRKAVLNHTKYDEVSKKLDSLLSFLTLSVEEEIRDATGRPKERPHVRGFSQPDRESSKHCAVCGAETHSLRDCGHCGVFMEERAAVAPTGASKRRCRSCHHPGHRRENCLVLTIARRRVQEEQWGRDEARGE
jgi:hypothetical protein